VECLGKRHYETDVYPKYELLYGEGEDIDFRNSGNKP
jgi:hypothetical protein